MLVPNVIKLRRKTSAWKFSFLRTQSISLTHVRQVGYPADEHQSCRDGASPVVKIAPRLTGRPACGSLHRASETAKTGVFMAVTSHVYWRL
jgi:hypothetical protein